MAIFAASLPAFTSLDEAKLFVDSGAVAGVVGYVPPSGSPAALIRLRCAVRERFGDIIAEIIIPKKLSGRPVTEAALSRWARLSRVVYEAIDAAIAANHGGHLAAPAEWTAADGTAAANIIVTKYANNLSSTAIVLARLRTAMKSFGASDASINATYRPNITREHNKMLNEGQTTRRAEGIEMPAEYRDLDAFRARVEAAVATPAGSTATAQMAADLAVLFAARPGELQTLDFKRGLVVGVLKKRGKPYEGYPVVDVIGTDLAACMLTKWVSMKGRTAAIEELRATLLPQWDLQFRDLRAIGAEVAVNAAVQRGEARTAGQQDAVRVAALRHEQPTDRAVDHYARVIQPAVAAGQPHGAATPSRESDPVAEKVKALTAEQRQQLEAFLATITSI